MFVLLLLEGQVESECERETSVGLYARGVGSKGWIKRPHFEADLGGHGHMFVSRLRHHYFRRPVCARVRERDKG